MKKLIAVSMLLLVLSATAHAQIDQPAGGDRLERMQKRLDLSDEQVSQLREIRQRGGSREEIRAVFTDKQWAMMQERRRQANARQVQSDPDRYYSLPPDSKAEESDDG